MTNYINFNQLVESLKNYLDSTNADEMYNKKIIKWIKGGFSKNDKYEKFLKEKEIIFSNVKLKKIIDKNELNLISKFFKLFGYIRFENVEFEDFILIDNDNYTTIPKNTILEFNECKFKNEFIIQNKEVENKVKFYKCELEYFELLNSIFKEKFEFKENKVKETIIENTNFEKLVDFFDTNFLKKFKIEKSIFSNFVGFEKSKFYTQANFKYITFMSFVNFRETKFYDGLDLSTINIKEDINFLNVEIDSKNTNRETFRLIKHSFDKIGNHIEANKFFVKEMKKYKEELSNKSWISNFQEKFIFWLNKTFSNFGSDYLKPIIWIFIFIVLYKIFFYGYNNNWLWNLSPTLSICCDLLLDNLNSFIKDIFIFKKILKEKFEFISLIFYIIFSTLIWMTIVAIKRNTKR